MMKVLCSTIFFTFALQSASTVALLPLQTMMKPFVVATTIGQHFQTKEHLSYILSNPPLTTMWSSNVITAEDDVEVDHDHDIVVVSSVSVCTAELCQCQGGDDYGSTGGASDTLLSNLRSRNLEFSIEATGCLGACGRGTMVAVDYDDGTVILAAGLEKTLDVLGLLDTDVVKRRVVEVNEDEEVSDIIPTTINVEQSVHSSRISSTTNHPAVDRMRATGESNVENPWLNMAVYLAQKVKQKMFE